MSESLRRYRELLARLAAIREERGGEASDEEDEILDQMDHVWLQLPPEERKDV